MRLGTPPKALKRRNIMTTEDRNNAYVQRIYDVLGEARLALPTTKKTFWTGGTITLQRIMMNV